MLMKTILKKLAKLSFYILAILCITNVQAQVIQTENFDGGVFPPPGWTTTGPASLWVLRNTGTFPTCNPHSAPSMARFTSRMQMSGTQDLMTSTVVDFSGNISGATPTFSLWMYRDGTTTAGDSLTISVNTSASLTGATRIGAVARSRFFILPVNELADGWYQYTFNVPSTFNADTNYFLLNGTSRNGANIYIDDLEWVAYPELCTGTPIPGTISANNEVICGGPDVAVLTLTGANNFQSGVVYHWQSAPTDLGPWTDFALDPQSVTTDTLFTSTYFRCYVECTNAGLADSTAVLFINVVTTPAPDVVINLGQSATYCTGYPALELIATGASTYTWTPNISVSASGDSALAAPTNNTIYTIVGTDTSGCTDAVLFSVNVRITPNVNAITNNDTICEGDSTNLQAQIIGPGFGLTYEWLPGLITGQNVIVSPTVTTSYSVEVTATASGCVGRDTLVITVVPAPISLYTFSTNSQVVTFTDNSTGAISWLWDFGDGNTSTLQNPVHYYSSLGSYIVTLTVSNGTCNNVTTQTVDITQVGLPQLSDNNSFLLYPNPSSEIITIAFESIEKSVEVSIIDALGKEVSNYTITPVVSNQFKSDFDLKQFAIGIYSIQISVGEKTITRQFVKN